MDEINDGFLATLMAKSNDNVRDILKSVSLDETLEVQRKTDLYAMFLLGSYSREGGGGAKSCTPSSGREIKNKGLER